MLQLYTFRFHVSHKSRIKSHELAYKEAHWFKVLAHSKKQAIAALQTTTEFKALQEQCIGNEEDKQQLVTGLSCPEIGNVPVLIDCGDCLVDR